MAKIKINLNKLVGIHRTIKMTPSVDRFLKSIDIATELLEISENDFEKNINLDAMKKMKSIFQDSIDFIKECLDLNDKEIMAYRKRASLNEMIGVVGYITQKLRGTSDEEIAESNRQQKIKNKAMKHQKDPKKLQPINQN